MTDYRDWRWSCSCGFSHISRGYIAEDIEEAHREGVKCPECTRDMPEAVEIDAPDPA